MGLNELKIDLNANIIALIKNVGILAPLND